jgi:hypothetical protein
MTSSATAHPTPTVRTRSGPLGRLRPMLGSPGPVVSVVAWIGAALLVWSSVIHLHLWSQSYHQIPTIGPLFLLQGIAGLVMAVAVAVARRFVVLVGAALFALGTVAGLLISVNVGLFGFKDSLSAPFAKESLIVELVAAAVLAVAAGLALRRADGPRTFRSLLAA